MAVQVAGGFIGEQHVRIGGERAGNRHTLLLASGQLAWRVGQAFAQPHALQQVAGFFAGVLAAFEFHRQHDVFQCIQAVEQLE